MEKSAREESCLNETFRALNMIHLTLLRYKIHGTDQDPLCEQQLDFIFCCFDYRWDGFQ